MTRRMRAGVRLAARAAVVSGLVLAGAVASRAADPDVSADEKILGQSAAKYVEAYNKKDAAALAALFAEDARIEEADGEVIEGRAAIRESYEDSFEANPRAQISLRVDEFRFLTPDVAVEQGSTEFFPDGETLTVRSRYLAVHVRKGGTWSLTAARSFGREVLTPYEHLRDLEWLVGEWVDEGADAVVESTYRWDENKAFLIHSFEVRKEGAVVLKGTERLGWDPQRKQIRGWHFDTAGGFGQSRWTPTDDGWIVKVSGTTANGESMSATRTLERTAKDRVVFSVTSRLSGDEPLPDVAFTLVRRAPQPVESAARP